MNNSSYVFISYAHRDSGAVLPCVEAMKRDGIRLWYDEGIEAGSEWPEFIAEKVVGCTKFVLFVSNAYLDSQNCKRELNFAISRKKDILTIYLENVSLSPGMEMQLGTYQAIYRNRFGSADYFHNSLCREHYFDSCRSQNTRATTNQTQTQTQTRAQTQTQTRAQTQTQTTTSFNSNNTAFGGQQRNYANNGFGNSGQPSGYQKGNNYNTTQPRNPQQTSQQKLPKKRRSIVLLLALFFGGLGIQRFYLGQPKLGILCIVLCFTYIPFFISIIECVVFIIYSKEKLQQKYGYDFIW